MCLLLFITAGLEKELHSGIYRLSKPGGNWRDVPSVVDPLFLFKRVNSKQPEELFLSGHNTCLTSYKQELVVGFITSIDSWLPVL